MENIFNNINNDINKYKQLFDKEKKIKINNFLKETIAETLYKNIFLEKDWILSTGIDKNKYEKRHNNQFYKINQLQIKNINQSFLNNKFTYIFYKSVNTYKFEYILNSEYFINVLNSITGLELKKLTTFFISKYSSNNFLSIHSDKGNGKLAFVINLTKNWKPQYGGILHFLDEERKNIIESYVPDFNNIVLFYIPEDKGIPHYVSHVVSNIKYSKYAITGWYE